MYRPATIIIGFASIIPTLALGAESSLPVFSFDAFGTLGLVHSSEDQADFTASQLKPSTAGFSNNWSADVDSILGVQLTAEFSDKLTGVIQLVSELTVEGNWEPQVEWANLNYQFTPEFNVRVGRTILPTFITSPYRNIGFATPWLRPPIELHDRVPMTSSDGISASYETQLGDAFNRTEIIVGQIDSEFNNFGGIRIRDGFTVANTFEYGELSMHTTYSNSKIVTESIQNLFQAFRQLGDQGVAIADTYDSNGKVKVYSVGASYNPGDWFIMGERGHIKLKGVLGETYAYYMSGGYRFGKITPYLTLARSRVKAQDSEVGLDTSLLPPELAAVAVTLNQGLQQAFNANSIQETISLGARWELNSRFAVFVQFDHIDINENSTGSLINIQPGFQPGGSLNVFSATLDFVLP